MRNTMSVLAALALLGGAGVMVTATCYAQTQGMDRRDDRRDNRQDARSTKQDCKANDEKSRAGCRQEKRTAKHTPDKPAPASSTPPK